MRRCDNCSFPDLPYCTVDCGFHGSIQVGQYHVGRVVFSPIPTTEDIERFADEWRNRADKDTLKRYQRAIFGKPTTECKGWICPKCDNAVSPDEKVCPYCKPKPKKESDNGKSTHITE